jgi:YHS domain-containing protein
MTEQRLTARDPVCGRRVVVTPAALREEYADVTYYFHAQRCLDRFTQDADIFTSGVPADKLATRDRGQRPRSRAAKRSPVPSRALVEVASVDAGPG